MTLLTVLGVNTMVLEIADAVSTAGFVSQVGPSRLLWLWLADMVVTLVTASTYAVVVDRMARLQLVTWLLGGLAAVYLVLEVLFLFGVPAWLTYPLLYVVADQQLAVFPLALWALANDIYGLSESRRLFPVIASGTAIGSVAGDLMAAALGLLLQRQGKDPTQLLVVGSLLFLVTMAFLHQAFRRHTVRARRTRQGSSDLKDTLKVGVDFFTHVPLMRYLALCMLLVQLGMTIVEFYFLTALDQAFAGSTGMITTFLGLFKLALITGTLLVQWLLAGRLLARLEVKKAFLALPATLVVASGWALGVLGVVGGAVARFLGRLVEWSWDEPARKMLEGLVPDERRGRISTFVDSYFYALGTIAGCVMLRLLFLLQTLGWLPGQWLFRTALGLGLLCGAIALWAAQRLRDSYDESLLNWRFARSRRRSVLDDLEF